MISAFNNSLVPPPVQGDPRLLGSLVERSDELLPEPTLTVEQALKIVRIKSYEEGYQDGLRDGKKEGYRDAIAALHNPSALVVKDKDALGHGSYKRGRRPQPYDDIPYDHDEGGPEGHPSTEAHKASLYAHSLTASMYTDTEGETVNRQGKLIKLGPHIHGKYIIGETNEGAKASATSAAKAVSRDTIHDAINAHVDAIDAHKDSRRWHKSSVERLKRWHMPFEKDEKAMKAHKKAMELHKAALKSLLQEYQGYSAHKAVLVDDDAIIVKDKDALGHGSYKKDSHNPSEHIAGNLVGKVVQRLKRIGSAVLQSRVARFLIGAEHKLMIVAHKTRDIAEAAAKRRKPPPTHEQTERLKRVLFIADFVGGYVTGAAGGAIGGVVGAKVGMILPSASALYVTYATVRDPAAVWSAARDVVKETLSFASTIKAFLPGNDDPGASFADLMADLLDTSPEQADWREAVFLAALADGLPPNKAMDIARHAGEMPDDDDLPEPQEEDFGFEEGINAKALRNRMKKRQWISAKIAIIMKDGIRGHAVSQAQAVAVAHKLWNKKRNRRRDPMYAKAKDALGHGSYKKGEQPISHEDKDDHDNIEGGLSEHEEFTIHNRPAHNKTVQALDSIGAILSEELFQRTLDILRDVKSLSGDALKTSSSGDFFTSINQHAKIIDALKRLKKMRILMTGPLPQLRSYSKDTPIREKFITAIPIEKKKEIKRQLQQAINLHKKVIVAQVPALSRLHKAVEIVWMTTGGISVDAERLQFKKTDGAEDGLNDERRNEDMDREFNPLEVPPIAVWRSPVPDKTDPVNYFGGQVFVVDGHKRLDHAKRKGVPAIRAFFIDAETFEEAKKKGELLNEKMGTKAFDALEAAIILKAKDAKGHEHKGKGPGGGQFTSGTGGGGTTKERKGKKGTTSKDIDKHTLVANITNSVKDRAERRKELHKNLHVNTIKSARTKYSKLLARQKKPGDKPGEETGPFVIDSFESGHDAGRESPSLDKPGAYISRKKWELYKSKAMDKITRIALHPDVVPTKEDAKDAKAGIAASEGNTEGDRVNNYRRKLVGNNTQRRERAVSLADEFGDGEKCGCIYCGLVVSFSPAFSDYQMEQDKIVGTKDGGKYYIQNLLPSCGLCNESRGNKSAIQTLQRARYGQSAT